MRAKALWIIFRRSYIAHPSQHLYKISTDPQIFQTSHNQQDHNTTHICTLFSSLLYSPHLSYSSEHTLTLYSLCLLFCFSHFLAIAHGEAFAYFAEEAAENGVRDRRAERLILQGEM